MPRLLSIPLALAAVVSLSALAGPERRLLVNLSERDGTQLAIRMTLRIDGDRWELYSRPGAVNAFIDWRQRLLGRLTRKLPPKGALIHGTGTVREAGDSLVLRGTLKSQFLGTRYVKASVRGDQLRGALSWPTDTQTVIGTFAGMPNATDSAIRDYRAITASVRDSISHLVFDERITRRPNVQEFFRELARAAELATDDLDMVAAFARLQPLIGISHFGFIRNPRIAATPLDSLVAGDTNVDPAPFVNFSLYGNGAVGYLRVSRWDRASRYIKRAFERMDSAATKVLIIDLVSNGGGDATSLVPATYLFRDSVTVGMVVGRPWFAAHQRPPSDSDASRFQRLSNEEEAKSLLKIVTRQAGVFARFGPRAPYFGGEVYVLVNGGTGSASEPLAHLLKATGRATLIGARTAGAMLTALPHGVGDGFIVTVPEADYYAASGVRLEGRGVEPHIQSDDPHVTVNEKIRQTMPYPALLMLAQIAYNRTQYDAAERYWTQALAMAPTEANKRTIQQRLDDVKRARSKNK
jgi:hypothetical protein